MPKVTDFFRDFSLFKGELRIIVENVENNPEIYYASNGAEIIFNKYFNREKIFAVQWINLFFAYPLNKFFSNVNKQILEKLRNDKEYHIAFVSDQEGWSQEDMYIPLCESANEENIQLNKLIFLTANRDAIAQYKLYADATNYYPPIKIIIYDDMLRQQACWHTSQHLEYNMLDPERYYNYIYNRKSKDKNMNNVFLHLSRISRSHRVFFNYLIYTSQYRHLFSFSQQKMSMVGINSHKEIFNFNKKLMIEFIKNAPHIVDTRDMIWNHGLLDIKYIKLFSKHLINIVGETNWDRNTFLTEKTYKPIGAMMPFVTYATPYINTTIKSMGFKLFDNLFDYSFDKELNVNKRLIKLWRTIANIAKEFDKMSWNDSLTEIKKYKDICIHNYAQLQKYDDLLQQKILTHNL